MIRSSNICASGFTSRWWRISGQGLHYLGEHKRPSEQESVMSVWWTDIEGTLWPESAFPEKHSLRIPPATSHELPAPHGVGSTLCPGSSLLLCLLPFSYTCAVHSHRGQGELTWLFIWGSAMDLLWPTWCLQRQREQKLESCAWGLFSWAPTSSMRRLASGRWDT